MVKIQCGESTMCAFAKEGCPKNLKTRETKIRIRSELRKNGA
jgi:hypothetical protein